MGKIKVLPEDVARQIAAGEVVERPASVMKELLENALDAGASALTIRTRGAGIRAIEVRDNGAGMAADDVVLAMRSFSTSKIESAADLFKVGTYGFRGEALASISSVSRFELVSSDRVEGEGWRHAVEGKTVRANEPAPHGRGTTVRVEDLFFNTPARKKFLKSDFTERRRILETVLSCALIRPDIEIHYSEDDRPVLDLVPTESWRDRVAEILGTSTMEHMVDVTLDEPRFKVRGFVSLPTHTRSSRNHQFYYVNGRLVKEKTILQAVLDAYRGVVPYRRFPVVILSIEIPFEDVDVNVHPNKLEVRIRNERRVFDVVRRAVKNALSGRAETQQRVSYVGSPASGAEAGPSASHASFGPSVAEAEHRRPLPGPVTQGAPDAFRARVKNAYSSFMSGASAVRELNPQLSLQTGTAHPANTETVDALKEKIHSDETLFWQFNNSFIFIQVRNGLVVIDQHAAHERIIYDTCKSRLEREVPVSQQILFPIHLELSLRELDVFRTSRDVFEKLGFHLEPFGGKSILVRGYPQGLKNWEEGKLLRQIFDDILRDRVPGESHAERIVASFACRSAVKAGQKLGVEEMKMLADQLFAVSNPYSCPHGRPTIQRIALEEIEGWFLRR